MTDTTTSNNSRKRTRYSSIGGPSKRARRNSEKGGGKQKENRKSTGKSKKKLTIRRRLTGMKKRICELFEQALTDSPDLPVINHLFKTADSSGTPRAPLVEILRSFRISNLIKNTHHLNQFHWASISNITYLFKIEEDEPGGGLYLKYRPVYKKKACTVYVDNLPEGCNREKLLRIAKCYGNVTELRIAKKPPRMIRVPRAKEITNWVKNKEDESQHEVNKYNQEKEEDGTESEANKDSRKEEEDDENETNDSRTGEETKEKEIEEGAKKIPECETNNKNIPSTSKPRRMINIGSRPRSFGFIRFVEEEPAERMIHDFRVNDPSIPYLKAQMMNQTLTKRPRTYREFHIMRLVREIRRLKQRKRRRPFLMFHRLARLRGRLSLFIRKERKCRSRAWMLLNGGTRRVGWRRSYQKDHHDGRTSTHSINTTENNQKTAEPTDSANVSRPSTSSASARSSDRRSNNRKRKLQEYRNLKRKNVKPKKTKRKRKHHSRKLPSYIPGRSVKKYFTDIQVISLSRYEELKKEYLEMVAAEKAKCANCSTSSPISSHL
ncbi:unnamed protein product [Caenorhabditis bovis]|uniref:RRM domain-containing protein n=1 Tax=Caenorhabditis bovis TaxID=2654633 RepID=A0A8S1F7D8_9PELO|nr:unnamed protein product [Caenorhabditis bovis]